MNRMWCQGSSILIRLTVVISSAKGKADLYFFNRYFDKNLYFEILEFSLPKTIK